VRYILVFILILFSSISAKSQWEKCSTLVSERLVSIYADTTGLVLVGGIDGVLLKSDDFAKTLRIVKTNTLHTIQTIVKVSDSLFLARIGNDGNNVGWKLYYSTDKGETWNDNKSPNFHFAYLQYVNGALFIKPWAYNGSPNQIYKSVDNGKVWKLINTIPTSIGTSEPLFVDDSNWYVSGLEGLIMYSSNAGADWTKHARGVTTAGLGKVIKVEDTVAAVNGPSIWSSRYKQDKWSNVFFDNWYPGGEISYSGKYWWRTSQRGTDYSSSVFNWEGKRSNIGVGVFTWIDTKGNGYALSGNNLYKTTNHGIVTTSLDEDDFENSEYNSCLFKYFNYMGQEVNPGPNQLMLKLDLKTGTVEKVIIVE
jgi:hypothetical protein